VDGGTKRGGVALRGSLARYAPDYKLGGSAAPDIPSGRGDDRRKAASRDATPYFGIQLSCLGVLLARHCL